MRDVTATSVSMIGAAVAVIAWCGTGPAWAQDAAADAGEASESEATRGEHAATPEAAGGSKAEAETLPWYAGVTRQSQERARALHRQGAILHKELRFVEAIIHYEQALASWEHPEIRFQMARAVLKTGQALLAWHHLQEVWQWGPEALVGDKRTMARELEATLMSEHLAIIEVHCGQAGVAIELNGEVLFRGPGSARQVVRPGQHTVTGRQEGYFPMVQPVAAVSGQRSRVTVELSPDLRITKPRWAPWKPWAVVGATGAVVALVGGGLRLDANRRLDLATDRFKGQCSDATVCDPLADPGLHDQATLERDVGLGAIIVGGAMTALGLALVWANWPEPVRSQNRSRPPFEMTPIIMPSISARVSIEDAGLSMQWRF